MSKQKKVLFALCCAAKWREHFRLGTIPVQAARIIPCHFYRPETLGTPLLPVIEGPGNRTAPP
jgi:hypothetical protein